MNLSRRSNPSFHLTCYGCATDRFVKSGETQRKDQQGESDDS